MKTSHSSIEILEARIAPASFRWNLAGSGVWNAAASWFNETSGLANDGFPNAAIDVAKFTAATTASATVTVNAANTLVGSIIFDEATNFFVTASGGGSLLLGSAAAAITVTTANGSGSHAIGAPITLASPLTIAQGSASAFILQGAVSDGGFGITKNGVGQLTMQPPSVNTITGTTTVSAGTLLLNSATATLGGPVIIGGAGATAQLTSTSGNLLADTAPVTVGALGTYALTLQETIGALTINDGTVSHGAGGGVVLSISSLTMTGGLVQMSLASQSLTIGGNISATASASSPAQILGGIVSLFAATCTIDVPAGPSAPTFTITSQIGSGGGVVKTGAGSLQLAGSTSNSFASGVTVNGGLLLLAKTGGANALSGPLTIGDGIGGADADGVRLFGANQIADSSSILINSSGLLDLNGNSETMGALSVVGGHATTGASAAADLRVNSTLTLNAGRLTADAAGSRIIVPLTVTVPAGATGSSFIDGRGTIEMVNPTGIIFAVNDTPDDIDLIVAIPIIGGFAAAVQTQNNGTLALDAVNTYGGGTTVFNPGTLSVGGQIGAVVVNAGATLTGSGTTGAVSVAGFLRSDSLSTGSITGTGSPSSGFAFNIDGTTPGDGPGFYDQLAVTGTVSLNNAALIITGGADFAPNTQVVLIANDGVDAITGTFNSFPEGSSVFVEGRGYLLSYAGGDGNDVVLTPFQYRVFEGGTLPDADDIFVVRRDLADEKLLHITVQSSFISTIVDVSLNEFAGVLFRGGAGNDTLIFDGELGYFNSGFQFVSEIIFDGGSGTNELRLNGGAALGVVDSVNYFPAGPDGGSANFSNQFEVAFDGVSTFFSSIATTRFEFIGTIGAPDEIALLPGAFPEEAVIAVPGQVPVTLRNQPTINLNGSGGADHYRVGTFAAAAGLANVTVAHFGSALATLTVEGSTGSDTFTLDATTRTITRAGQPAITYEDPVATIFDGGAGNDVLQIVSGSALGTTFIGGPGTDALSFANSTAAVGFNADRLGDSQTLNGLGWELTLGDLIESFTGSPTADQITIAPGTTKRFVDDPNGTLTLILDGLGSALTINGPLLNNASGTVTLAGLADPTLSYGNVGVILTIHVPTTPPAVFGTPGNTFAAPLDFGVGTKPTAIATGDLNGDGRADFVTADKKSGTVSIALSTLTGLLLPAVQKSSGGLKPTGLALADLDGDLDLDIAVTNKNSGNVGILLNNSGVFTDATLFSIGEKPRTLRAGDIDGDLDIDLVAIIGGNQIARLINNGTGTFTAATPIFSGSTGPVDLALIDLDSDSDRDLLLLHTGGALATRLNGGTGNFADPTLTNAGTGATALALGDFNRDGTLDAAVAHNTARFISILLGQTGATFAPQLKVAHPISGQASALVAGDFDGDGTDDLAIANGIGGTVNILRSLGTGAFVRALKIELDDTPARGLTAIALGNFDGDGRDDLALAAGASGEVSLIVRA